MPLSEVQMPPPGPVKLLYQQVDEWLFDLVSYQPRPIPLGPFCHTRIPVEDQKDGGLYKRGWSVISYLMPDKDKLLIRMLQLRVALISNVHCREK